MTIVLPAVLDGGEVDQLRPVLMRAVRTARGPVRLAAAQVELISSSGLGLLAAAAMVGAERGVRIEVIAPSELFRRSLALTGVGRHLGITPEPALVGT